MSMQSNYLINYIESGMNALFGLKTNLSISERAIVATATATAAYISALPAPMHPRLVMTTSTHSANHHHDQQYLQRCMIITSIFLCVSGVNVSMNYEIPKHNIVF